MKTPKNIITMEETQIIKPKAGLELTNPKEVMAFAGTLKQFIKDNKLSTNIQGKEYAHVDGWKFAGLNFGLTAIPYEPVKISPEGSKITIFYDLDRNKYGKEYEKITGVSNTATEIERLLKRPYKKYVETDFYNYKCNCDVIHFATGNRVGSGFATCSNLELKKAEFDEYAVASMAQTRAIGKAYRNVLGFIMNAAGFDATPAEEMEEEKYTKKEKPAEELASESQIALIKKLVSSSVFTEGEKRAFHAKVDTMTKQEAIKSIEWLQANITVRKSKAKSTK